jgi:hypothetical protein
LRELSAVRGRLGLGIERDLYFTPEPAKFLWEKLKQGQHV